ncbi:unnamed protein product [Ambrosiozyma monospora]|uniref:Unnamed protein product n=1 Tax=Ambrosiozyma monospora TaxID=43982 RepID=A0A9W6Z3X6_AMBMO|nr:unnamed protein product [Ambrosiozyma monospora]
MFSSNRLSDSKVTEIINGLKTLPSETTPQTSLPNLIKEVQKLIHRLFKLSKNPLHDFLTLNNFKSLSQRILAHDQLADKINVIFLIFNRTYYNSVEMEMLVQAEPVVQYLHELQRQFFPLMNLQLIYSNNTLISDFNFFLLMYSQHQSELIPATLLATTRDYSQNVNKTNLNYLQTLTVECLSINGLHEDIVQLYDDTNLTDFDSIDNFSIHKSDLVRFFVHIIKALRATRRFEEAHDLLQVVFKIPHTLKSKDSMEELTSILVINSIQIANAKDDDPTKPQLLSIE